MSWIGASKSPLQKQSSGEAFMVLLEGILVYQITDKQLKESSMGLLEVRL